MIDGIISALMKGGVTAAEAYIIALDPAVFAIPIVAWLMDEGIGYLAQVLEIAGEKFATAVVIDIQTNGEESAVVNAGTELAIANASGNQEAIQNAVKDATAAYASAIHWDGSATPS